jgi:hypothetical protein
LTTEPAAKPRLYTWSWRNAAAYKGGDVELVRISIGRPRFMAAQRVNEIPYMPELAPLGGLFHIEDAAEFRTAYWERLDGLGVARIEARFARLLEQSEGRPLVLLCYEHDPKDCHRSDFAVWWEKETGERVPEFAPAPEQDQPQAVEPPADPLF